MEEWKYKCERCKAKYKGEKFLIHHVEEYYTNKCEQCGKNNMQEAEL